MSHCFQHVFCRFTVIFIENATFEEFEEIYGHILKEQEIYYYDEKKNIDLLTNFY